MLLKNAGGLLPLDGTKPLRILITGPSADEIYCQLGDYTPPVRSESGATVRQGLEEWLRRRGGPAELTFRPGCDRFAPSPELVDDAAKAAGEADVIVAALGGTSSRFCGGDFLDNGALADQSAVSMDCGENVDAALLRLPGDQMTLLRRLRRLLRRDLLLLLSRSHWRRGAGEAAVRGAVSSRPSAGLSAGPCGAAAGVL